MLAALVAAGGLVGLALRRMGLVDQGQSLFVDTGPKTAFLFRGNRLVDATPHARSLLAGTGHGDQWAGVMGLLGPMFPGLVQALDSLPQTGEVVLMSAAEIQSPMLLRIEDLSGLTRLTMVEATQDAGAKPDDAAVLAALHQEVGLYRDVAAHAPLLMWREDARGSVTWANRAFIIRAVELLPDGQDLSWPLPRLFDAPEGGGVRVKLQIHGVMEWFDLIRQPQGDKTLCYAIPANAVVRAEAALREFMQTLTKTFADLPIGLAIFDRARVLQLFNPALVDLTLLSPDFLIARPTLSAVLDALRAKAMLPEPKDYRSWRKQLTKVEEEAAQGVFEETWNLSGGRTYRVIGRPHPNGALAFMFQDISSETIRTRRYRADIELGQSTLDALDDGVAVFSQSGQLIVSNLAYAKLWQHDPAVLLSDAGIATLCAWWRAHSAPSLIWEDAVDFVNAMGDRTGWEGDVRLLDGRLVTCRFRPLTDGATLVAFRLYETETAPACVGLGRPQLLTA